MKTEMGSTSDDRIAKYFFTGALLIIIALLDIRRLTEIHNEDAECNSFTARNLPVPSRCVP